MSIKTVVYNETTCDYCGWKELHLVGADPFGEDGWIAGNNDLVFCSDKCVRLLTGRA